MPISYSCVCDAGAVVNESGDRDSVSKWGKIARALIERIEPRTRKSYEHEGYVFLRPFFIINPQGRAKRAIFCPWAFRFPLLTTPTSVPSHVNTKNIRNSINYIAESDRVYLAVADKAMNTRIIFAFLEKIRGRYAGENGSSFNAVLGEQMVCNGESVKE